jgi:YD repeat-containing protein
LVFRGGDLPVREQGTVIFYYDGLGRLTDIVDPLGILNQPTTHYDYQYGTPDNPVSITTVKSQTEFLKRPA